MVTEPRLVVSASQRRELARLLDMDDEIFVDLVDLHRRSALRGGLSPDTEWALRQDEILDRFLDTALRAQRAIKLTVKGARLEKVAAQRAHDHALYEHHEARCRKAEGAGEGAQAQIDMIRRLVRERKRRRHEQQLVDDAYNSALHRLRDAHPDEFAGYLADEHERRRKPSDQTTQPAT